jgi:DNA polymerase-1
MRKIVFDIEANGLDPTEIWCVVMYDIDSRNTHVCYEKQYFWDWLVTDQMERDVEPVEFIGHNILGYDIPVLEKLWDISFAGHKLTDTLVMSRLAEPSRQGGHSLESWGDRLGCPKGEHSDWLNFSQDMVEYCKQDVRVNELVYKRLLRDLDGFRADSLVLEGQVQRIISKQIENGWVLDQESAFVLLAELKEKKYDLEDKVHETFKPLPYPEV